MTQRTRQGTVAATLLLLTTAAGCVGRTGPAHAPQNRGTVHPAPSAAGGAGATRGFTLVASGDMLAHDSVVGRARADAGGDGYDFRPMLAGIKPVVSRADLAICQYPTTTSLPQLAKALGSTGYDSCSTTSNQSLDALDTAGVRHAGSARTAAEARRPAWLKAGGAKVAQLAYTSGTNGVTPADKRPWAVSLIDEQKIVADARAARRAGADVVVVSLDWGRRSQTEPDEHQLNLGRRLTGSTGAGRPDIDLVLGTQARAPQPYEKVNGTWIVYGMGAVHGSIGRFTFAPPAGPGRRWEVKKAEFVPTWMDTDAGRVINLPDALRRGADRDELREAQQTIRAAVLSRGAVRDGLTLGR
ncbi:CapA family protein [Streptomyces sp.]|uniref:CapA family protein n=1 Tax=Streptomyces sp. TaxID=1931 RepID=UPI002D78BD4A|nr:CapA family protein [Streptomyces sp.]HET6359034.1 CapA family protein [Streptomyces sp.]